MRMPKKFVIFASSRDVTIQSFFLVARDCPEPAVKLSGFVTARHGQTETRVRITDLGLIFVRVHVLEIKPDGAMFCHPV